MSYNLTTPIRHIKGVGPVRAKEMAGLGIKTVLDLLEYRPSDYIFPGTTPIRDLRVGEQALIQGKVVFCGRGPFGTAPFVTIKIEDETGKVDCTFFGQIWLLSSIRVGMTITVWGKTSIYRGAIQFSSPKFSTCNFKQNEVSGGLYGKYTETVRAALRAVLGHTDIPMDELAYGYLHFPSNKEQLKVGLDKLKFNELLIQQTAVAVKRRQQEHMPGQKYEYGHSKECDLEDKIKHYFPYKFTTDQDNALRDVLSDLYLSNKPMNRLLFGEVASGKTAVAFYAAMLTALNDKRAIILCPTTLLATQHDDTLRGMGWNNTTLIIGDGGMPPKLYHNIVIGTTAILNNRELLKSASLVVIDEQQKFGVKQRAELQQNGQHLLMLSATPIPRTIALTVFGDLDVSTIREMPIKRGAVVTRWVMPDKREQMYEIIDEQLAKGRQAYIVYPRIKSGDEDMTGALTGFALISIRFGAEYDCDLLTGEDSNQSKTDTLRRFKSGDIKILVSTIIAEVGLDNSNATVMVIEGADRFGLSQLHQLRGRICRSTETALCFMVAETANDTSIARLRTLEQTNDGFEIAEQDLRLRGPGEMFSTRQHGLPDLKFTSLIDDYDLLLEARELAKNSLDKLNMPEYNGVREMLAIKFKDLSLIGVA